MIRQTILAAALVTLAGAGAMAADSGIAAGGAAADGTLVGTQAFGSWQDNKPGVRRMIRPQDLPAPFATKSSSNAPGVSPRPEGTKPVGLEGFDIEMVADDFDAFARDHALGAMWGEEENRADVLQFNPDGTGMKVFAAGIRNCSGMTVQPSTGNLWCVTNERDELGDNVPPDYATQVKEGAFYGWPWYYIGDNPDPRAPLKGQRPDLAGKVTVPDVLFQAHSAPLNITFYEGGMFPREYTGDAFVAMHGSWNRGNRTGYKIVRLMFDNGKPTGAYEDFVTGFVLSDGNVWGRPVGVTVGTDGALYFTEDGSGSVWRVSHEPSPS